MSTVFKLRPSAPPVYPTATITQFLIDVTGTQPDDRVMVIGRNSFDHLLGLVRGGCNNAVALRPQSFCHSAEMATEVVWLTGVTFIDAGLNAIVNHLGSPRVVAIELARGVRISCLTDILARLRAQGLVDQVVRGVDERTVVVASRPTWLRQIV